MTGLKMKRRLGNICAIVIYGILAGLLVWMVCQSGTYPGGSDTMCHIYRGDILYKEILNGNFYPLLDPLWYNGVELLRYEAPLPLYVLALCEALTGGNPFDGYLLFVGCVFFFGAVSWLWIGNRHGRMGLGAFFGALWFFMPNNLYLLFEEGNLPGALCLVFLPWLLEQIYLYLRERRWKHLLGILLCFSLITLCHLEYAGMLLTAVLLFLILYGIRFRGVRKCAHVLIAVALAVLLLGVWTVPAWKGGLAADNAKVMETFFQDAAVSLNPFYRVRYGAPAALYFGLAAFLTAVLGMLFGKNRSSVFFGCALAIFVCTTTSLYPVLSRLPGGRYLQLLRFLSIALCLILFGLMLWNTLKKKWLVWICVFLALDTLPSLSLVYGDFSGRPAEERMKELEEATLLTEAKAITTQRLALMDVSSLGSVGAFLVSDYGTPAAGVFGADWQSAATADNVMLLNEALENGSYYYLFDRCLELGSDTVVVQISRLHHGNQDLEQVQEAAEASGYRLVQGNDGYQLYHLDTYAQFGTVGSYQAIGIGKAAELETLIYPAMEYGASDNLNDYSLEELEQYRLVYLDGFVYDNKTRAEELVTQLSEAGVRVVIQADDIPLDEHTGTQSFLDVTCQPILFSNGYPLLDTIDGELDCDLFPSEYTSWRAVYLNGLDECWGRINEMDEELMFYGTVKNENIVMIGLNLSYFYSLTRDEGVGRLLSHAMTLSGSELPERTIVPLEIEYGRNRITVRSAYEDVNTGLAWHGSFDGNNGVFCRNQLTYVKEGETVIRLRYPYLGEGLCVSAAALGLTVLFLARVRFVWRKRYVRKIEITEVARPVKGRKPEWKAAVPEGVRYAVSEVNWSDEEGKNLEEDAVFGSGRYLLRIVLRIQPEEHFDRELKAAVNGLNADKVVFLETDESVQVEMSYQTMEPFRFLQQPQSLEGVVGEPVTVKWSISKVPKVGYLQVWEHESWIICDTLPREAEWELSMDIRFEAAFSCRYRLAYIMGDGKLECSQEFVVNWRKEDIMITEE